MEIAPGIHMIEGTVGERPLQLFLLNGEERRVLVDSGCAPDPERMGFPYLERLGLKPSDLDMVVNTHPDLDHCGGNAAVRRANPKVLLTCGDADRELVESPEAMWSKRYNAYSEMHALSYSADSKRWIFEMLGEAAAIDFTWSGGEILRLGLDWTVEIHHTPGHSPGHLSIFDPRSRTVLIGDAVQGAVYLDIHGNAALCPTYLDISNYRATVRYLRALGAGTLAGCHWPVKRGVELGAFLDETAQFVAAAERIILGELRRRGKSGATLKELIGAAGPQLGEWPRSVDLELMYAIGGHMEQLAALRRVNCEMSGRPVRYSVAEYSP